MNYKALLSAVVLGFLLLVPVGLIVLPKVKATETVVPSLYVNPPDTKFYGPCLKSTYFKIDVILWNNPLALIHNSHADVYAFDFDISWASISSISLVNATYHSPWTNYFVIKAGNTTNANTDYDLAITAVSPSLGLTDVNMSVLTLWFHINVDVCWPATIIGTFALTLNSMSGDGTVPVPITDAEIDSGTYEQYSVQPNIDLTTTDAAYNATTNTITEKCVSHTFDIEVDLTNVTNAYGFSFTMTYDPLHLETDAQHITFKAAFPPPYETLSVTLGTGIIYITLMRPSEKPAVCGSVVPAVDIVFHTIDNVVIASINPITGLPYAENGGGLIPTTSTTYIHLSAATVYVKCPGATSYTFPTGVLLYGGDIKYVFKPSKYDLNLDCVVDVQDLMVLLPYYGTSANGPTGTYADLWPTLGITDIFDFVAIAKKFGPVDP